MNKADQRLVVADSPQILRNISVLSVFSSAAVPLVLAVALLTSSCGSFQPGVARASIPVQSAPMAGGVAAALTEERLNRLLPADAILLGEQHDAAEHQQIHQQVIASLARRGLLAALVIEMADTGSSTEQLRPGITATDAMVQQALDWNEKAWPWQAYAPAILAAVQAGVPVVGANLPRADMAAVMADSRLDTKLSGPALKAQQQAIRIGHCNALPESQITPMTRIQIARDQHMADAIVHSAVPGKVVVLMAGSAHVNRELGVPLYLPATLRTQAVVLQAASAGSASSVKQTAGAYDGLWATAAVPEKDYCAAFRK